MNQDFQDLRRLRDSSSKRFGENQEYLVGGFRYVVLLCFITIFGAFYESYNLGVEGTKQISFIGPRTPQNLRLSTTNFKDHSWFSPVVKHGKSIS